MEINKTKKPLKPRLKYEDYQVQICYYVKKKYYIIANKTIKELIKQYK